MWIFLGYSSEAHLFQDKTTSNVGHDKALATERYPGYKRAYQAIDIIIQAARCIIRHIIDSNKVKGIRGKCRIINCVEEVAVYLHTFQSRR